MRIWSFNRKITTEEAPIQTKNLLLEAHQKITKSRFQTEYELTIIQEGDTPALNKALVYKCHYYETTDGIIKWKLYDVNFYDYPVVIVSGEVKNWLHFTVKNNTKYNTLFNDDEEK